ncbi:gluconolactonase [Candidatus Planktophila dulcis]|uniref:Gluconolactonase n=1 Tax=Candidatus Planktophila dulcis TaxID=1884914 RepID=A0AAC9YU42_9ACTN|nr:SMP-30/gluconolactonase/LRE family protein [Candidatus Planktophila dulcis]ASY11444.1 gluconolactonase [Candidatus Planktophila dulcis]
MTLQIRDLQVLSAERCLLGEGIQIDISGEICSWVDIKSDLCFVKHSNQKVPKKYPGLVAPSKILSIDRLRMKVLHRFGISEVDLLTGEASKLLSDALLQSSHRSNDGEIFSDGSIWFSRMGLNEEFGEGSIWRWNLNSSEECMIDGLTIPNTILKLPDSEEIYFADSASGALFVAEISGLKSELINVRTFAIFNEKFGIPDGSCLDKNGNLWNCRWGAGLIIIVSPKGEMIDEIELPMKYPTSCKLDSTGKYLFITSANPDELADEFSGHTIRLEVA